MVKDLDQESKGKEKAEKGQLIPGAQMTDTKRQSIQTKNRISTEEMQKITGMITGMTDREEIQDHQGETTGGKMKEEKEEDHEAKTEMKGIKN